MVLEPLEHRSSRQASEYVAKAFAYSLLFHCALFLTVELGHEFGLWNKTWLLSKRPPEDLHSIELQAERRKAQEATQEIPLVFVDVDPSQASPEPPPDAKYYSALNSRLASPDTKLNSPVPKISGTQEHVPQTLDKARTKTPPKPPPPQPQPEPLVAPPKPLEPEPAPPKAEPVKTEIAKTEASKPEPPKPEVAPPEVKHTVGDLAYAKPVVKQPPKLETRSSDTSEFTPTPPRPRPRRLAEVVRPDRVGMAGPRMKQEGGARRFAIEPSFDVRATPFGTYDAKIIAAIQQRWYDLLDQRSWASGYSGKVVVEFRLNSDGRVTDMKVSETDVTELLSLLCQRAVQDPAPFDPWPPDLRRLVGKEYREVRFTFYYN